MRNPDWFVLIEQWRARRMGQYGITLPFLVGALARKGGQSNLSSSNVRGVLTEVRDRPVADFVTEVSWCREIDAPVFSVARIDQAGRMPFSFLFSGPNGKPSLGFSQDLASMFHLNCVSPEDCLEKLITYVAPYVEKGNFSRVRNSATGVLEYAAFSPNEIQFIKDTIGL